jgi:Flp pilus assembly protein TadG
MVKEWANVKQSILHIRLARTGSSREKRSKLRRGQSLVEMAISMVVLILLFSGVFDLGRVYFALVMLNNAVSEGAHWAANFPLCLPANTSNSTGGFPACQNSNSIVGRIVNEENSLDRTAFKYVCWTTQEPGQLANPANVAPGSQNTVTLWVKYREPFTTPVITGLFGSYIDLTATVQEVIRGSGFPTNSPQSPTFGNEYQGSVSTATCNSAP